MRKRFTESNASLMSFAQEIFVKCPKCSEAAVINAEYKYFNCLDSAKIQCLKCTFNELWDSKKFYGKAIGKAKQPCPNCGSKWLEAELKLQSGKPSENAVEATCKVCHQTSYLNLNWTQDDYPNEPFDPFFKFPLWLQTSCVGQILWTYNKKHLDYLKSYVEADLRDDDFRMKWSMISNLPKWIILAKNRDKVLKAIVKLNKKLENIKQ